MFSIKFEILEQIEVVKVDNHPHSYYLNLFYLIT